MSDPNKLAQFTMTDRKFLIQDVEFWAASVDTMLQFYRECSALESVEDRAAKAVACARLAGLGAAMLAHFESGVDTLIDTTSPNADLEACEEAGGRIFEMCEDHSRKLEMRARKDVS